MSKVQMREISPSIYIFSWDDSFFHANSAVIITQNGPVIIDVFRDKNHFQPIVDFLKGKGFENAHTIIYTHWHIDHTCGNREYLSSQVVAHKSLVTHFDDFRANHMERMISKGLLEQDAALIYPTVLVDDKLTLNLGDRTLELFHCPGHSYDSIVIFETASKTLFSGDNLVNKEEPFFMPPAIPPDAVDAKPEYFEAAYRLLESFQANTIIPGHGSIIEPKQLLDFNRQRYAQCIEQNLDFIE